MPGSRPRFRRALPAAAGVAVAALLAGPAPAAVEIDLSERANHLRSTDGGRTFVAGQLDDVHLGVDVARLDAGDGSVHAVFSDATDFREFPAANPRLPEPKGLWYRRSRDGGRSFTASVRLDTGDGASTEGDVAAARGSVHVAWEEQAADGAPEDVLYARSDDGGHRFRHPVPLTETPGAEEHDPAVAAHGDRVVVAWEEQVPGDGHDVVVRTSDDGGRRFAPAVNLTPDTPGRTDEEPAVAVSGSTVVVAYSRPPEVDDDVSARTMWVRSGEGGAAGTWSAPAPLPGGAGDNTPAVHAADDVVHVLACDQDDPDLPGGEDELLHWRSTDGGATFADAVVLARRPCAKVAVDGAGDDLHVVVEQDVPGGSDIVHLRSDDAGRSFRPARNLSFDFGRSRDPDVAVDATRPDDVHVAWTGETEFLFTLRSAQELPREDGRGRVFADEDVVRFTGGVYEMVLDGSDVGLGALRIDALAVIPPDDPPNSRPPPPPDLVLSFDEPGRIPGVGRVDDSDLVRFTPTKLGERTAGRFVRHLDGSDIGLEGDGEDVDAVEIAGEDLYLSTAGRFSLRAPSGDDPDAATGATGGGEDVFVCRGFAAGGDSSCAGVDVPFNGSRRGFTSPGEEVDAFSFTADGPEPGALALFSTAGSYRLPSARGGSSDLLSCLVPEAAGTDGSGAGTFADCGGAAAPFHTGLEAAVHGLGENLVALAVEGRELREVEPGTRVRSVDRSARMPPHWARRLLG